MDAHFKDLYERKIPIEKILFKFNQDEDISFLEMKKIKEHEILNVFSQFIKKEYKKKFKDNINIQPTKKSVQTNYQLLIKK